MRYASNLEGTLLPNGWKVIEKLSRGFDLRLISWGDGSEVPTSGKSVLIAGIDNKNLLHIRIFNSKGDCIKDTDETSLLSQAEVVANLKCCLSEISAPFILNHTKKEHLLLQLTCLVNYIPSNYHGTGGHNSVGYRVRNLNDGRDGFLKAIDYSSAFECENLELIPKKLFERSERYNFEKSLCERCSNRSMKRVVHAIGSGTFRAVEGDQHSAVSYLIFDLADGDIRTVMETAEKLDIAFALRSLHHVATGLKQLHQANIAHQDLKPSNILVFKHVNESKLGDLGNAWSMDLPGPHDNKHIPGDATYAPPELLYQRHAPSDLGIRRFGNDFYYFGSLIVFYFTGAHMNSLINKYLSREHRYHRWNGTFHDALPFLQDAFVKSLNEFRSQLPYDYLKSGLTEIVKQLCEPNPSKRGDPLRQNGGGNPYSLERYISGLNHMAFRAETDFVQGI